MTWFKVDDGFPRHPKVLAIPRGAIRLRSTGLWLALGTWCADQLTDGHFAHHMVEEHGGTKADVRRLADVNLFEPTASGWVFHDWADWQPTKAEVESDRAAARERMRKARAKKKPFGSADVRPNGDRTSGRVTVTPSRPDPSTAAAAAEDAAAAADPAPDDPDPSSRLPPTLEVFRSKLQTRTVLAALRFDTLTPDQTTRLEALVDLHGDERLVDVAASTCRNPAPTYVTAFLGTWEALPEPGQRLGLVRQELCPTHKTVLSPSGTCSGCVVDQRAADR